MIEVFTFLQIGADIQSIAALPIMEPGAQAAQLDEQWLETRMRFAAFDVREARCFSADEDTLMGAIESGFDEYGQFNRICSHALLHVLARESPTLRLHCR